MTEYAALALCASNLASGYARAFGEMFERPNFLVEIIKRLPWSDKLETTNEFKDAIQQQIENRRRAYSFYEPYQDFCFPHLANADLIDEPNLLGFNKLSLLGKDADREVGRMYNLNEDEYSELELDLTEAILFQTTTSTADGENRDEETEDEAGELVLQRNERFDLEALVQYAVGCLFGRWDIRMAVDPDLVPPFADPFEPLQVCPPGMLIGTNGLPAQSGDIVSEDWLRLRPNTITLPDDLFENSTIEDRDYPIQISWNGLMPDFEGHPDDIVKRIRQVLQLLRGSQAEEIESRLCEITGSTGLRDYMRRHFFKFHISCYSKSRRKAPLYWLLQSERRSYAVWLYYPRIGEMTYFAAGRDYTDQKLKFEQNRLDDLREKWSGLEGTAKKRQEREIDAQEKLVTEVKSFGDTLDKIALQRLTPDHNDGVIISIAPLHSLVPWKDAAAMWKKLLAGDYTWSSMSQAMKKRGLIKG